MPKIEYIIVTSDYNPKFVNFLPTISHHWRSMGYKVVYGIIASHEIDKSIFEAYCDKFHFWNSSKSKYPNITLAKLYRFYLTKFYKDSIVCVQDIDYYVCDKHHHVEKYIKSPSTEIYVYGTEAYYPTLPYPTVMKFPATPCVSYGRNIFNIFNVDECFSYDKFLEYIELVLDRIPEFDDEKSISMLDNHFSDERIIRKLISVTKPNIIRCKRDDCRNGLFYRRIDRSTNCKTIDPCPCGDNLCKVLNKKHTLLFLLKNNCIIDIQPMRPLDTDDQNIRSILNTIGIPNDLIDTKII